MGNFELREVNSIRILGLIMDNKLTWILHMKRLKESCLKMINVIKYLANINWGTEQNPKEKKIKHEIYFHWDHRLQKQRSITCKYK